jgi:hypothetical protein
MLLRAGFALEGLECRDEDNQGNRQKSFYKQLPVSYFIVS